MKEGRKAGDEEMVEEREEKEGMSEEEEEWREQKVKEDGKEKGVPSAIV